MDGGSSRRLPPHLSLQRRNFIFDDIPIFRKIYFFQVFRSNACFVYVVNIQSNLLFPKHAERILQQDFRSKPRVQHE